jgi:hypothetical protein
MLIGAAAWISFISLFNVQVLNQTPTGCEPACSPLRYSFVAPNRASTPPSVGYRVRRKPVLGGLDHEYWLENVGMNAHAILAGHRDAELRQRRQSAILLALAAAAGGYAGAA